MRTTTPLANKLSKAKTQVQAVLDQAPADLSIGDLEQVLELLGRQVDILEQAEDPEASWDS